MLNVAIVEDENQAAQTLTDFLNRFSQASAEQFKVTRFPDPTALLERYQPSWDIIFMDIEMPNMNGMNAAYRLREYDQKVVLIFVTNMAQFAAKGYEVNALDYIIKPYSYPDFERKIARAAALCANADESIVVTFRGGAQRIRVRNIEYIEVRGHNVQYHTETGLLISTGSLQKLELALESKGFLRCSKAYLVNPQHVVAVNGTELKMNNGDKVPIGRAYHKIFMQELASVMGNDVI